MDKVKLENLRGRLEMEMMDLIMRWRDIELTELKSLCKQVEPNSATRELINVRVLTLST